MVACVLFFLGKFVFSKFSLHVIMQHLTLSFAVENGSTEHEQFEEDCGLVDDVFAGLGLAERCVGVQRLGRFDPTRKPSIRIMKVRLFAVDSAKAGLHKFKSLDYPGLSISPDKTPKQSARFKAVK